MVLGPSHWRFRANHPRLFVNQRYDLFDILLVAAFSPMPHFLGAHEFI
jgi:hypothetical protein